MPWVLIVGNPFDGVTCIGPLEFKDMDELEDRLKDEFEIHKKLITARPLLTMDELEEWGGVRVYPG